MSLLAEATIDAIVRQSKYQRRQPPELSLMPPPAKAIINVATRYSYHQCHRPPKLSLTPLHVEAITDDIFGWSNH